MSLSKLTYWLISRDMHVKIGLPLTYGSIFVKDAIYVHLRQGVLDCVKLVRSVNYFDSEGFKYTGRSYLNDWHSTDPV